MCADLQHEPQPLVTLYEIGRLEISVFIWHRQVKHGLASGLVGGQASGLVGSTNNTAVCYNCN